MHHQLINFDPETIKLPWRHPTFFANSLQPLNKRELEHLTYDYFLKFMPHFRNQPEGSLQAGTEFRFTRRLKHRLGQAELFLHRISLNQNYFTKDPRLLPYTLFHEMVHMWLYDCLLDPGHTVRFYEKMQQFTDTGLPVDQAVHIHRRIARDAPYVFVCANCHHRWFVAKIQGPKRACGFCHETHGRTAFPSGMVNRPSIIREFLLQTKVDETLGID